MDATDWENIVFVKSYGRIKFGVPRFFVAKNEGFFMITFDLEECMLWNQDHSIDLDKPDFAGFFKNWFTSVLKEL